MMQIILALGLSAIAIPAIAASTNDTEYLGQPSDPRVTACGIRVETGQYALIVPFVETTTDLGGHYRLEVTKSSRGGSSRSVQANAFSGPSLGSATITVDWPADVTVVLSVTDEKGASLCDAMVKLDQPAI